MDANDDLDARWSAVANRLRAENIEVPSSPERTGTIIDSKPRVGIWLMPNNTSPGELENFVSEMIPNDDPVHGQNTVGWEPPLNSRQSVRGDADLWSG